MGKGGRKGNINVWLPLTHPLLGTWPATQACDLTGNSQASAQSTEPHQPGLDIIFLKIVSLFSFQVSNI